MAEETKTDWKIPVIVISSIVGLALIIGFVVLISNGNSNKDNKDYLPTNNYYCGDSICNENENCKNCPRDCGECPKEYPQFVVKVYSDTYGEVPFWELPENPGNQNTATLKKNSYMVYAGAWLAFYTDYDVEDIRCEIKEYYDGSLNSQFTSDLKWMGSPSGRPNQIGSLITPQYEDDIKPSRVRYDYTCKGVESGNQYSGSYTLNLIYSD